MNVSSKISSVGPSPTLVVKIRAEKMKAQGRDVIDLSAGDPDFDTPWNIKTAAERAIEENFTHYTAATGIKELKRAVIERYLRETGHEYSPEQVIVSTGAKQSLFNVFFVVLDEGDEVILPRPYWVSYPSQIRLAGGKPVFVDTFRDEGYSLPLSRIRDVVGNKTRAILINSPCNPTGSMLNEEEIRIVARFAHERGLLLISDECYDKYAFHEQHFSVANLNQTNKLVVNSLSKTYAMTGWRIGFSVGSPEIISSMGKLQSHSTSNPCSVAQKAAVAALTGDQSMVEQMTEVMKSRLDYIRMRLKSLPKIECYPPQGAFYLWIDISSCLGGDVSSSTQFARRLLENHNVATTPGVAFGDDNYIRLSVTVGRRRLGEAVDRLEDFLGEGE